MRDTERLKTLTEKMETNLTSKQVERRLEEFQNENSTGNLATTTKVEEYERIAHTINDAISSGIEAAPRHNTGYHRSPALTEAVEIVR